MNKRVFNGVDNANVVGKTKFLKIFLKKKISAVLEDEFDVSKYVSDYGIVYQSLFLE